MKRDAVVFPDFEFSGFSCAICFKSKKASIGILSKLYFPE